MSPNSIIVPGNHYVVGSDTDELTAETFQVFLVIIAENPVDSPYIVSQFMKRFVSGKIFGHNYLLMSTSFLGAVGTLHLLRSLTLPSWAYCQVETTIPTNNTKNWFQIH